MCTERWSVASSNLQHEKLSTRITWCYFSLMVAYPFPANGDAKTPPRQVTTNPPWPTPAASMSPPPVPMRPPVTPRSGKTPRNSGLSKSARASPYMTPNRVTISDGSPMVLFTPKQLVAQKEAQRRRASSGMCSPSPGSMGPPTQPRRDIRMRTPTPTPTRSRSSTPLFPPPQPRVRKVSTTVLAPAAVILGTPATERRLRDLARPPVELLQVLGRCVDDDWEKNVGWTLRDGLSNGRSEDRDVSRKWDPLCAAVSNFWPDILQWIMNHTPTVDKQDWFLWSKRKGGSDEYIDPQVIASKYSSLDRVGFNSACSFLLPKVNASVTYHILFFFLDVQCQPGRIKPAAYSSGPSRGVVAILWAFWMTGSIRSS